MRTKSKALLLLIWTVWFQPLVAQDYDFSGTWNGTIRSKDPGSKALPFTLVFSLIDSCTLTYRTFQYEQRYDEDSARLILDGVSYNMLQANKTLLRDAMSYWKDFLGGKGSASHLRVTLLDTNKLVGRRTDHDDYDDTIILTKKGAVNPSINRCYQQVAAIRPCLFMNTPEKVDTLDLPQQTLVTITVADDGVADSDRVTLFVGSKALLDNVPIYRNAPYAVPLAITSDTLITWCACNQGKYGLNTGILSAQSTSNSVERISLPVHLETNRRATLLIRINPTKLKAQAE